MTGKATVIAQSAPGLPLLLDVGAAARPEHPAVVWGREEVTFAELHGRVSTTAARLAAMAAPGDRVAWRLSNGPRVPEILHAVAKAGGIGVALPARVTEAEAAAMLGRVGPRLLLAEDSGGEVYAKPFGPDGESGPAVPLDELPATSLDGPAARPTAPGVDPNRPALIVFTSGTRGVPKGVVLTHGNLFWSAVASALRLGMQPADRWLAPLPLHHMGGLSILTRSAMYGTTVALLPRFDVGAVHEELARGTTTVVSMVPTMLHRLLESWDGDQVSASLRVVLLGGGAVSSGLVAKARAAGFPIAVTYGQTEAASQIATGFPTTAMPPDGRLEAVPALAFSELAIDPVPEALPGEGEILVRGPTVMQGYWADPDATARSLDRGWLRTGDLGSLDHLGRLRVTARRGDRIVTGGENVAPAEVEAALESHPDVRECAVVGLPDEEWGQVVAAAVVLREGAASTQSELADFLRTQLTGFKIPRRFAFVPDLPRTESGKPRRGAVAALFT